MELKIEIETGEHCLFKIVDLSDTYLPEEQDYNSPNLFKFSDTISVIAKAVHNSKSEDVKYLEPLFIKHEGTLLVWDIPTEFNGVFDFTYIVIPTKEWFDNLINLELYSIIYYSDGNYIYKYLKGNTSKVDIRELAEINPINTTISKVSDDLVSICFLKKYFIDLCNQIYEKRVFSKCKFNGCVCKDLIHKRDLIWTIINMISYYTEEGSLNEAQRLIELAENCDYIFDLPSINTSIKNCSCQ